jgi:hypothetical protein
MKINNILLIVLGLFVGVSFALPDAEAECGKLGVMSLDGIDLPEGVDLTKIRKCRDHPRGRPATPE